MGIDILRGLLTVSLGLYLLMTALEGRLAGRPGLSWFELGLYVVAGVFFGLYGLRVLLAGWQNAFIEPAILVGVAARFFLIGQRQRGAADRDGTRSHRNLQ